MDKIESKVYIVRSGNKEWLSQIVLTSNNTMNVVSDICNFNVAFMKSNNKLKETEKFISNIEPNSFIANVINFNKWKDDEEKIKKLEVFKDNIFVKFQKMLSK